MSKRSKDMLKLSYDKLNLKLPDLPKVNPAPSPSKHKLRERLLDEAGSDGTNLSVFSPSEMDLLNDDFSPIKKCQVWSQQVNKHYGVVDGMYSPSSCDQQEVDSPQKKAPPSTPGTPKLNTPQTTPAKMHVVRRLVAYSPSGSTSTYQSGSMRTNSPLKCSTVLELVASRRAAAKRQLAADSAVKDSVPCFGKDINENIQKPLTSVQDSTCGRPSKGKENVSSYQRSGSVITDSPLKQPVPKDCNKENESLKKTITSCQMVNCSVLTPSLTVDDSFCMDSTDSTSLQNPSTNLEKTSKPVEGFKKLSAYQKLRLKNIAENEKCIREVIQNNPQCKAPEVLSPRCPLNDKTPRRSGNREKRQNYSDEDVAFDKTLRRSASKKNSQNYSDEDEQSTISDSDEDDQSEYQPDDDDQSEYQPDDDGQSAIHSDVDEQEKDKVPSANDEQDKDDDNIQQDPENPLLQITIQEPETQPRRGTVKERSERKMMWNSGKSFVRPNGEVVSAREWKPPHVCKISRKCHEHINEENGRRIFSEYWSLGDHNKRVAYVAARIEWSGIDRKRLRKEDSNREKEQNFKYFLEVNKKRIQVCRSTFLNTLSETDRFVRNVTANKAKSVSGITSDDARGRHKPTHALQQETLEAVQKHIRAFPAYESHYCRAQTQQLYLPSHLTVSAMHSLYKEEGNPPVSYSTYRKEFNKSGRKFKPPKSDGCDKCDKLKATLASCSDEAEKKQLETSKELHLRKAEKAYALKKEAKKEASKEPEKKRTLVFDLQQCLPTPHLKCKRIYYSRQLYVFNFTIFDNVTGLTHCYMWDQVEGKRGSNEIGSCLLQHILEEIPTGVEELNLFSDCCSGQNRNHVISMMIFVALQEHPTLKKIVHYYLVPGHTFMPEVDSKHSVIENYKKKRLEKVSVPSEWYDAVSNAGKTAACPEGKFIVIHKTEFFELSSLAKNELVKRTYCLDKEPFNYLSTHIFSYEKKSIGIVNVKSSFNEDSPYRQLSFLRRGVRSDRLPRLKPSLKVLPGNVPISKEKKKDLISLLDYLEVKHHDFYRALPTTDDTADTHPDLTHDEDDI